MVAELKLKRSKKVVYVCSICNVSLSRRAIVIDHIEGVHLKLLLHQCKFCDKIFNCKSKLRTHISRGHRAEKRDRELLDAFDDEYELESD